MKKDTKLSTDVVDEIINHYSVYLKTDEEYARAKIDEFMDEELYLVIPLLNSMGNNKNTRSLGKDIIAEIRAQGKDLE